MTYTARIRHAKIMKWLEAEHSLSIDTLASRLNVSIMTVHRDLDHLAKAGHIQKVHGGAEIASPVPEKISLCTICKTLSPDRTLFTMQTSTGETMHACCPHCGLLMIRLEQGEISLALARDFLYGRMVNVMQAYFVVGSKVSLCCVPGVICFATDEDATHFTQGFGGEVLLFRDVQRFLHADHEHRDKHC